MAESETPAEVAEEPESDVISLESLIGSAAESQMPVEPADEDFEPEGVADALMIPSAVELGGKDSGTGAGTEDAQVEHEQQTVDDGYTAHGQGAHLTDHHIV